jgi:hypothetical protein
MGLKMKNRRIPSKRLCLPERKDCYAQVRIRKAGSVMCFQEEGSYEDIAEYLLWNSNVNTEKEFECEPSQSEYQLVSPDHL